VDVGGIKTIAWNEFAAAGCNLDYPLSVFVRRNRI
jgi:hypothetical protein